MKSDKKDMRNAEGFYLKLAEVIRLGFNTREMVVALNKSFPNEPMLSVASLNTWFSSKGLWRGLNQVTTHADLEILWKRASKRAVNGRERARTLDEMLEVIEGTTRQKGEARHSFR